MEDVKDSDIDDWIEEDEEDASTALAKPQELEEENEKHQSRGPGQPQEEEKEAPPAAEDLPTSPPSPPAEEVKEPAQEGSLVHATRESADGMGEIVPQHISGQVFRFAGTASEHGRHVVRRRRRERG